MPNLNNLPATLAEKMTAVIEKSIDTKTAEIKMHLIKIDKQITTKTKE